MGRFEHIGNIQSFASTYLTDKTSFHIVLNQIGNMILSSGKIVSVHKNGLATVEMHKQSRRSDNGHS
jgi:hypothetical protein